MSSLSAGKHSADAINQVPLEYHQYDGSGEVEELPDAGLDFWRCVFGQRRIDGKADNRIDKQHTHADRDHESRIHAARQSTRQRTIREGISFGLCGNLRHPIRFSGKADFLWHLVRRRETLEVYATVRP